MGRIICLLLLSVFGRTLAAQWVINKGALLSVQPENCKNLNSSCNDYCPLLFKNQIYFVSDCSEKGKNVNQFDIYSADGSKGKKKKLQGVVNTAYHEGPLGKNKDQLVFTRSTSTQAVEVLQYNALTNSTLKLRGDRGLNLNALHPTFSKTGIELIATIKANDTLHIHTNLQDYSLENGLYKSKEGMAKVNSLFNDCFPRLVNDSILIFASDRPGGYGGLDLYVSFYEEGHWQNSIHLPEPVNSPFDDFGLVLDASLKQGYFNSNRPGGKGGDDIYSINSKSAFFLFEEPIKELAFDFEILDILTFLPLEHALIKILPITHDSTLSYLATQNLELVNTSEELMLNNVISEQISSALLFKTDSLGQMKTVLPIELGYFIEVAMPNYQHQYLLHVPLRVDTLQEIVMVLSPEESIRDVVARPIQKGQRMTVEGIGFNENKLIIESFTEDFLNDLSKAMKAYPTMLIQLIGYTDSRGNAVTNFRNSQIRAENLKKYLIGLGVESDRIISIGEGENKILNQCVDGIECTENQHKINNRIEIMCISE